MQPCGGTPMRPPRPARVILTDVSVSRLRPWTHLPRSPGITVRRPANQWQLTDPSASRTDLAWCQTTNPDRYRSELGSEVTALEKVGLETQFRQPDFLSRLLLCIQASHQSCESAPAFGRTGINFQSKPAAALALSSQYWVCSSVQPGTAKRLGVAARWPGRKVTRWCVRKWFSGSLERCTVAAQADALKVIKRPKAKADRIVLSPSVYCLIPLPRNDYRPRAIMT
jgi:hypothetical protein